MQRERKLGRQRGSNSYNGIIITTITIIITMRILVAWSAVSSAVSWRRVRPVIGPGAGLIGMAIAGSARACRFVHRETYEASFRAKWGLASRFRDGWQHGGNASTRFRDKWDEKSSATMGVETACRTTPPSAAYAEVAFVTINAKANKVFTHWPTPTCQTPHAIAIDRSNRFISAETVQTKPGARTKSINPKKGCIFLVAADVLPYTIDAGPGHDAIYAL